MQGNVNFLKMSYLLEHKDRFDSIIMGSSRVRYGFDPSYMNSVLGGKWYKMEYPNGTPSDHLRNLKTLLKNDYRPKNIILSLDDLDIYKDRKDRMSDYFYRPYPDSLYDWVDFYIFYLFKRPTRADIDIFTSKRKLKVTERILHPAGYSHGPKSLESHKKRMLSLPPHGLDYILKRPAIGPLIEDIRAIINLCKHEGIGLKIIVTPRHYKTLLARDFDIISAFKMRLAYTHSFIDFTGLNKLSMDNSLWLDTSHFFIPVGRRVVDSILKPVDDIGEFGSMVNEGNVISHIRKVKAKIKGGIIPMLNRDDRVIINGSLLGPHNYLSRKNIRKDTRSTKEGVNVYTIAYGAGLPEEYGILKISLLVGAKEGGKITIRVPGKGDLVRGARFGNGEVDVIVSADQIERGIKLMAPSGKVAIKSIRLFSSIESEPPGVGANTLTP